MALPLFRARADWNRRGPHVPVWFRRRLRRLDQKFVLQYRPPRTEEETQGVSSDLYPEGVWDVCRKTKTGYLTPVAVWSLTDSAGNYSPPGADTLHLLEVASHFRRKGEMHRMEALLEDSVNDLNRAAQERSDKRLRDSLTRFCKRWGDRQWPNRVFLRREIPKGT